MYQGDHRFERPLSAMMLAGFLTEELHTEVVTSKYIDLKGVSALQLRDGGVNVTHIEPLADQVVQIWIKEGRPPTLVRFRASILEVNARLNEALARALERAGARVIRAFGPGGARELKDAIEREDNDEVTTHYRDVSEVILACHRASEGMDSPHRCLGISIGLPKSESLRAQLLGRIMRPRVHIPLTPEGERDLSVDPLPLLPGYPDGWIHRSKQVFIVGDSHLESRGETRDILLMLAVLDGHSLVALIRKMFKSSGKADLLNSKLSCKIAGICCNRQIEEAIVLINSAMDFWDTTCSPEDSPLVTMANILQWARLFESRHDALLDPSVTYEPIPEETLRNAFRLWRLSRQSNEPEVVEAAIRGFKNDFYDPEFQSEFDALCDAFRLEAKEGHLHELYGGNISDWGSRLENLIERRSGIDISFRTLADVESHVRGFVDREHRLPSMLDKITDDTSICFRTPNYALTQGRWGRTYPGGLPQYWIEHCGYTHTWKDRIHSLASEYRDLVTDKVTGLWDSRHKCCPVKMYLGAWVKYAVSLPLPENLDLETACTTSPKAFTSVDLARRAEQIRMDRIHA